MDQPSRPLPHEENHHPATPALRILIAEDEAPVRGILQVCVEKLGHFCLAVDNGVDALELLIRQNFDILITDISMPRMDGLALLAEVRRQRPETDVIVITGHTDRYTCKDAIAGGANDFLAKPFSTYEFEAKLARAIRERRLIGELQREIASRRQAEGALQVAHDELEARVQHRTRELAKANRALEMEIEERRQTAEALTRSEEVVAAEKQSLVEINTALKVLLAKREDDRREMEADVVANIRDLVDPYLHRLRQTPLAPSQASLLDIAMRNIEEITSPIMRAFHAFNAKLTPAEIQIANLVRQGLSSKEIAECLSLSPSTVDVHRRNIRRKAGLTNSKLNLRTMLSNASS